MRVPFGALFTAGVVIVCAILWTEIFLYSQNTLYLNDRWIVQKRMMEAGVMGGDEFLITRSPLAGNVLNLGDWHGYQDVVLREPVAPRTIRFRFKIPDESYLDLTYGRTELRFSGLRLSRRTAMPSFHFESTIEGQFASTSPFQFPLIAGGWREARVNVLENSFLLTVDESAELQIPARSSIHGQIGFRSGYRGATVDDIIIETAHGTVSETFRNTNRWAAAFCLFITFLLVTGAAISMLSSKAFTPVYKRMLLSYASISLVAIAIGGAWYAFDLYYWSKRHFLVLVHPLPSEKNFVPTNKFERVRFDVFAALNRALGGHSVTRKGVVGRGYPPDRFWTGPIYCDSLLRSCKKISVNELNDIIAERKPAYRILFVGTSQTVGAGAHSLEHTFFAQIYRELIAILDDSASLEALNISLSGSASRQLLEEYTTYYLEFSPHLVVINLSNNDPPHTLKNAISGFLKVNESKRIATVFVEEANCAESEINANLLTNHQILRGLAKQHNVPIFSLHEFLSQQEILESGNIWQDSVHLTSHGQTLTAQWLATRLLQNLTGRPTAQRALH